MNILSRVSKYRHFVVSWGNGRIVIAPAREVVPHKLYEVSTKQQQNFETMWNAFNVDGALRFLMKHAPSEEKKSQMA